MVLFDGIHVITNEQVIEKMKYFINCANEGMRLYKSNPSEAVVIAKQLRNELIDEYKNNSLTRISEVYQTDLGFVRYSSAVHQSIASITGQTTRGNVYSFLYDVDDYMEYHLSD